jgi:hypothetical protein
MRFGLLRLVALQKLSQKQGFGKNSCNGITNQRNNMFGIEKQATYTMPLFGKIAEQQNIVTN